MYNSLIERKESVLHFNIYQKEFFDRYFNRLFRSYNEELIFIGINSIRLIIQNQVLYNLVRDVKSPTIDYFRKSIEPDFESSTEYSDEDYSNAQHFEGIAHELIDSLFEIVNKSIKYNQPEIINKCYKEINELNFKFKLKKISVYIQSYFYLKSFKTIYSYTREAYEKEVFINGHDATNLTPALFEELIVQEHPVAREILTQYCYLLFDIQKINKLDRWFLGGLTVGGFITMSGELGSIVKRCAIKYNENQAAQNSLQDCVNAFSVLKQYYEFNPPDDYGLYLCIKEQFENILYWLKKENLYRRKIYRDVKEIISAFREKQDLIKFEQE